LLRICQRQV